MTAHPQPDPVAALSTWLLDLPRNAHKPALDAETDIIETGILDSLEFVNFLLMIETMRGREISADEIELDAFRTLQTIVDTFLVEREGC